MKDILCIIPRASKDAEHLVQWKLIGGRNWKWSRCGHLTHKPFMCDCLQWYSLPASFHGRKSRFFSRKSYQKTGKFLSSTITNLKVELQRSYNLFPKSCANWISARNSGVTCSAIPGNNKGCHFLMKWTSLK